MRLLVTCWRHRRGEGALLLVEDGRVVERIAHPVPLMGLERRAIDGPETWGWVVDHTGRLYRVARGPALADGIDLRDDHERDGELGTHDLVARGSSLVAVATGTEELRIHEPGVAGVARLALTDLGADVHHINGCVPFGASHVLVTAFACPGEGTSWRAIEGASGVVALVAIGETTPALILHADQFWPHSPRMIRGVLWWCDTRRGLVRSALGHAIRVPGLARGLRLLSDGRLAVGLSVDRHDPRATDAWGVALVDPSGISGRVEFWTWGQDPLEVYDVLEVNG